MGTDAVRTSRHHYDFSRPLDWRLQHARRLLENGCRSSSYRHDPDLIALVQFLRAEARCHSDRDRVRLEQRWLALHAAQHLHISDGPLRFEVQARILAGQTDDEIAARCRLTPSAVHWFEAVFFNVRDRLHARDWIVARVIGPGLHRGFTEAEIGNVWMTFGYYGGPVALDVVLAITTTDHEQAFPAAVLRAADLGVKAVMIPATASPKRMADLRVTAAQLTQKPRPEGVPARLARLARHALEPAL